MATIYNPTTVAAPLGRYSHGVEVPAGARWLYISGQVGMQPDGTLAQGIETQAAQAWANLVAILAAADMSLADVVKVTSFLTHPDYAQAYRDARDRLEWSHNPASTLLIVAGLASPAMLIEIEAVAAKA